MDYYMYRILDIGEKIELNQEKYNDFIPTTTSLLKYNNEHVNY